MTASDASSSASIRFSILHDSDTDIGRILLRRRWSGALERDVFEMTVDGKLMMSSAVVESEQALATRALARLPDRELNVLIGGLGFGFTARAVLADSRVGALTVVERLGLVIDWHRSGLLPWSTEFLADPRLQVLEDDFFALVARDTQACYDAVLVDIDDAPDLLWHDSHTAFYASAGLQTIRRRLVPGGVFGLWFATHPGDALVATAQATFATAELAEVPFENPCLRQPETNYLLLATRAPLSPSWH
jgi:spermidine synthase